MILIAGLVILIAGIGWWAIDSYFRACGDCGAPMP